MIHKEAENKPKLKQRYATTSNHLASHRGGHQPPPLTLPSHLGIEGHTHSKFPVTRTQDHCRN